MGFGDGPGAPAAPSPCQCTGKLDLGPTAGIERWRLSLVLTFRVARTECQPQAARLAQARPRRGRRAAVLVMGLFRPTGRRREPVTVASLSCKRAMTQLPVRLFFRFLFFSHLGQA